MQVILLTDRLGPARSFRLDLRLLLLAVTITITGLIWTGYLGFRILSEDTPAVAITLGKPQLTPQIEQLALRVGELQARMERLSVIGERVADKAGIPLPAPAKTSPGRGGPLVKDNPDAQQAISPAELASLLERLSLEMETTSDALQVLDAELLLRQTSQGTLLMDRPVGPSGYLSSVFGFRIDPFTNLLARHDGLDFADQLDAPILAAESGVVIRVSAHPQYGNSLDLDHGNGLITRYGHASKVLVKSGDVVKRGQEIAQIGSTGRSTGPHLHFEVIKDGVPQNPLPYLAAKQ